MERRILSTPPNYFYLALALDLLLYYFLPSYNLIAYPYNWVGLLLIALGGLLVLGPYFQFSKIGTSERFVQSKKLITKGVYQYSRNPMYLGTIIFLTGLSIFLGNILSFVVPLIFFFLFNNMFIPFEEEKGEEEFGQKYLDYKHKVRRWL